MWLKTACVRALADRASITIGLSSLLCGGNNSAEEDGYDYPARFRSPPSDFHNPSHGEEKAGESGGEVRGRDECEMRSESSRREFGAGGKIREKGIKIFHFFLSSPSPLFFPLV